jgi:homoserine O-acetyltransferase
VSARGAEPARRILALPGPWPMSSGATLPELVVAYESWGERTRADEETILLFTGLSPSAHAASSPDDPRPGWWEGMIGDGAPLDTRRAWVVCMNALGGCFGTSGPSTIDPARGRAWGGDFPTVRIEDTARAAGRMLRALGVRRAHTVVGASMGGMSALAYALLHPGEVERLVLLSCSAAADPWAIAIRSLQRRVLEAAPGPVEGLRLARALGLLSYRSPEEWVLRFGRRRELRPAGAEGDRVQFSVEAYLEARAARFAEVFDPGSYRVLSAAMDRFDARDFGGGDLVRALAPLAGRRICVVGVETDLLFPVRQQEELAEACAAAGGRVVLHRLPCLAGHDSFLVERETFGAVIRSFLASDGEETTT